MDNGEEFPSREPQNSETGNGAKSLPKQSSRVPFTGLSQVDSDLALARTLQEQERAFMMLEMDREDDGDDGSCESGSFVDEGFFMDDDDEINDDDDDEIEEDYDGINDDDDGEGGHEFHAYEHNGGIEDLEEDDSEGEDPGEDPGSEEFSYEELIALSEVVGTENKGLSADAIASLPVFSYKPYTACDKSFDECVICRLDFEEGELLSILPCKHSYHSQCINEWLQINKICPVCTKEVPVNVHQQKD